MADGRVGQPWEQRIVTRATSGETFTVNTAMTKKPDGTAWAGPAITHEGGGVFLLGPFTPDQAGVYYLEITGNTSGQVFGGPIDIRATPVHTFTRRANLQVIEAEYVNELQEAIEELSY
jgi:hypothetical protein